MPAQVTPALKQGCRKHLRGDFSYASGSPNHLGVHPLSTPSSSPPNSTRAPKIPDGQKVLHEHIIYQKQMYTTFVFILIYIKNTICISVPQDLQLCSQVCIRSILYLESPITRQIPKSNNTTFCYDAFVQRMVRDITNFVHTFV